MNKLIFFLCFFCLYFSSFSQNILQKDSLFLNHLLANREYKDATLLLNQFTKKLDKKTQENWDIYFWKGFSYYSLKKLELAISSFDSISTTSKNYNEAQFLKGISATYIRAFDSAATTYEAILPNDSSETALKNIELAGLSLLKRDFTSFNNLSNQFFTNYYFLEKQQQSLLKYEKLIKEEKKKSALKVAIMSAILPGAGKVYIGQLGQGISSFLQNALMGLQAYEGLRKDGINSPRFIIFGSLFTLFYVGNIWGSALSVKIQSHEFNDKINEQIMFDMHIPIRTLFNRN